MLDRVILALIAWTHGALTGAFFISLYTYWQLTTGKRTVRGFVLTPETPDSLKSIDPSHT